MELPHITEKILGVGGKIRQRPENFIVEEISLYEPSGEGEHLYINITKEGLTTKEIQQKIADILNIPITSIGFAGMKDKNARTTQTFSIKTDKKAEEVVKTIESNLPVTINWSKLHTNKLRIGHLLGNKFKILITDLEISPEQSLERAQKIVNEIKKKGLPNFFGPQRFGVDGKNAEMGLEIILGKRNINNKWKRNLLISSYQSYLCNLYLIHRLETGSFDKILKGDVAKKYDTGGMFEVKDLEKEQNRYENHEISFTAPIYGYKMWEAKDDAGELEKEILNKTGLTLEQFRKTGIKGTRRLGRLLVPDIDVKLQEKNLLVTFSLPKGSFATIVIREIIKNKI